jgi:ankyrin repeat protein
VNKRIVVAALGVLIAVSAYAQTTDFFKLVTTGTPQDVQAAIENGENVNAPNAAGYLPLGIAAQFNPDSEVIDVLLKAGADINGKDRDGGTALMSANELNHNPEVIGALLRAGADVNAQDKKGYSALMTAAMLNPDAIPLLLKAGADTTAKNGYGETALDLAWKNEKLKGTGVYQHLLAASHLAASKTGQTTDFFELAREGTAQQLRESIANGANVNAKDSEGFTLLMFAAGYNSNADVVGVLLRVGANVNAQDVIGRTPLMFAAENNPDVGVISTLIEAGADINARAMGMLDYTALMFAAANNRNPVVATLLRAGADIKARDSIGGTALMKAASSNHEVEVIATLLEAGSDLRVSTEYGVTAFLAAAANNTNPGIVTALLNAGADIESPNKDGTTALMAAAGSNQNPDVISTLLKAGADPKAIDRKGKKAFDYAQNNEELKGTDAYQELQDASQVASSTAVGMLLPSSFTGMFTDPDYMDPTGEDQNGWAFFAWAGADMNTGRSFTFTKTVRSLNPEWAIGIVTDDPDEALFFAKVDQETIRIMIRDKPAGSKDFWGTGSTGKVYTLKRKAG